MVFDPDPSIDFQTVREPADLVRGALEALGLTSYPMVTGGKGVHVVAPLVPKASFEDVARFAKGLAGRIAASDPDHFVATMSKAKRRGRIFIGWHRNERGQTAVAPYSTRATAGAPVATPMSWAELAQLRAANGFSLRRVFDRLADPDPWRGFDRARKPITKALIDAVEDED